MPIGPALFSQRNPPSRAERLDRFISAFQGVQLTWGVDDCSTWPAQWVKQETGRAIVLPAFSDRATAHQLIDAAGGLAKVWTAIADALGLQYRGDRPEVGDVGIISLPSWHRPPNLPLWKPAHVGGIFGPGASPTFAWRAVNGVRLLHPHRESIVASWSVP